MYLTIGKLENNDLIGKLEKWKPSVANTFVIEDNFDELFRRLEAKELKNAQPKSAKQPQSLPNNQQQRQQQQPKQKTQKSSTDKSNTDKVVPKKSESAISDSTRQNQQTNQSTTSISVNGFTRLFNEKKYSDIIDVFEKKFLDRLGNDSTLKIDEVPLACINLFSASHLMTVILAFSYF